MPTLTAYRHHWIGKNRDGWQYEYECHWSDGTVTREFTLPWGRMDGAVELEKLEDAK